MGTDTVKSVQILDLPSFDRTDDLRRSGEYEEIGVPFEIEEGKKSLEFRVYVTGRADLWVERIVVSPLDADAEDFYRLRMGDKEWETLKERLGR